MSVQELFSANVRRLREASGWTREELGEASSISPQNIAKMESGDRFVSAAGLEKLVEALDVPPLEFFKTKNEPTNKKSKALQRLNDVMKYRDEKQVKLIEDVAIRIFKDMTS